MEITVVRQENQRYFEPLMPDALWKNADFVMGVIEDETACAVLALKEEDRMIKILWLLVAEEFRRRGIGKALLDNMHELAYAMRMDAAYCQFSGNDMTGELEHYLQKNLFEKDTEESPIYRITFGELPTGYMRKNIMGQAVRPVPLTEVTSQGFRKFCEKFAERFREEDVVPVLKSFHDYDRTVSFLLMREGDPVGGILLEKLDEAYYLACLCVFSNASAKDMMSLFCASYRELEKCCHADTPIYINALTETTRKMVIQLTEEKAVEVGRDVAWYFEY